MDRLSKDNLMRAFLLQDALGQNYKQQELAPKIQDDLCPCVEGQLPSDQN